MPDDVLRIRVSRHAAFYRPLISTIAGGFLAEQGIEATYDVLPPGQRPHDLLRDGEMDVAQAAVPSNWGPMEQGETGLPVHFAQINRRDGFFSRPGSRTRGFTGRSWKAPRCWPITDAWSEAYPCFMAGAWRRGSSSGFSCRSRWASTFSSGGVLGRFVLRTEPFKTATLPKT